MRTAKLIPIALLALALLVPARVRSVTVGERQVVRAQTVTEPACAQRTASGHCLPAARCAGGEVELEGVCVPMQLTPSLDGAETTAGLETNSHVDRGGRLVVYEHIPRRPDLPSDYNRYLYPVDPLHARAVTSGYDLGLPDALQRRGAELSAVGHGGVDLPQLRGAPVRAMALRGQVGDPTVLYVGTLAGTSVLLGHVIREGGVLRSYVALHGHLDATAPGLRRGQSVPPGTVIGFVGDSGAEGLVHLHYEVRLVRPGIDPERVEPPTELHTQAVSVPCDPRNLLPLRPE